MTGVQLWYTRLSQALPESVSVRMPGNAYALGGMYTGAVYLKRMTASTGKWSEGYFPW